jgi:hypothetical protein
MMDSADNKMEKQTLVEEGTHFKGSLSSNCPIVVRGKIEGDVAAPSLVVSVSGAVHGKVKVAELRSQGELSGEFDADMVQLSGTVKDNTVLRAKSLEVKLSSSNGKMQVVFGECMLDVGPMPDKQAAIHPPAAAVSDVHASPAAEANGSSHSQPPASAKGEPRKSNRPPQEMNGSAPVDDDATAGEGGRRSKAGAAAKA